MQRNRPIIAKAASFTVSEQESGCIYLITAADVVATLPSLAGLSGNDAVEWTFISTVPSAGVGVSISPNALDYINGGTIDKDLINSGATDAKGDSCTIVGNDNVDADGWWTSQRTGTWAAEG